MSHEAAACAFKDMSFETVGNDAHDDVPISSSKAALDDEGDLESREVAAAANDQKPVEHKSPQI